MTLQVSPTLRALASHDQLSGKVISERSSLTVCEGPNDSGSVLWQAILCPRRAVFLLGLLLGPSSPLFEARSTLEGGFSLPFTATTTRLQSPARKWSLLGIFAGRAFTPGSALRFCRCLQLSPNQTLTPGLLWVSSTAAIRVPRRCRPEFCRTPQKSTC